jgi:hypothetical protein
MILKRELTAQYAVNNLKVYLHIAYEYHNNLQLFPKTVLTVLFPVETVSAYCFVAS